MELEKES